MTNKNKKISTSLILNELDLNLNLGITTKERAKKQSVLVTIKINFPKLPLGCETDSIADTICYDELVQKIKKFCRGKKFGLIEYLGMQLFGLVRKELPKGCKLNLQVAKRKPLPELSQSVFEIGN